MPSWPIFAAVATKSDQVQEQNMRDKIKLVSSAGAGQYCTTTKNKRSQPEKMEIRKFDPVVRKHVGYKEAKIK